MRDNAVVESIVAGDPGGLAAAYDEYGDLVYAYCRSMVGGHREAADAAQATFVSAAAEAYRIHDPDTLRAWLFALARSQCTADRRTSPAGAMDTGALSMAAATKADRAVLRAAIDGLSSDERDVLTLLWHGLDMDEAALVLQRPRNDVYSRLSRARDQLETSVGVLLVCSYGRRDCPVLGDLIGDWDGCLTERLRDRAGRHIDACRTCSGCRDRELRPAMLLSLTPGALLRAADEARAMTRPAPPWLRGRLLWLVTADDPRAEAECRAMTKRLDPFGKTGFPRARSRTRLPGAGHPRLVLGLAGALAAVAIVAMATPGRGPSAAQTAAAAGPALTGGAVTPDVGQPFSPGRSARPSPSAHRRSPTPTATPSASATPVIAQPAPAGQQPGAPAAAQGTLSVSPSTISVAAPFPTTITLTAHGGPVSWSVSVPSAAARQIGVSPRSGTLAAGQRVTISVSALDANSFVTTLTFSPGDHVVTTHLGFS